MRKVDHFGGLVALPAIMSTKGLVAVARTGDCEGVKVQPHRAADAERRSRLRGMVRQHHGTIWRFLRRLGLSESDTDDALQDVLMIAIRKIDAIDPQGERTFLLRTAYRVGCRLRAKRPHVGSERLADPVPHPDVLVDQKRARELLDAILESLTEEHRAVLVLHDIEKLTMAEIADALELKPGTVASRLSRARAAFDRQLARIETRLSFREVGP